MLREFGPRIWTSEGPIISFLGFRYPTRMAVISLSRGGLFVWSPIALSQALKQEVDALGSVQRYWRAFFQFDGQPALGGPGFCSSD